MIPKFKVSLPPALAAFLSTQALSDTSWPWKILITAIATAIINILLTWIEKIANQKYR